MKRLTVGICVPLAATLVEQIRRHDPAIEVLHDPALLPTPRWVCDHAGTPTFARSAREQQQWQASLASIDVAFGIPGDRPEGLVELTRLAPNLRWIQATSAGVGEQVRRAALSPETTERVAVTSASGVHGTPLAEFAIAGVFALSKDVDRLIALQRNQEWSARWPMRSVRGMQLVVLGFGGIGQEVARLAQAIGMRVIAIRRGSGVDAAGDVTVWPMSRLDEALSKANALISTLPGTPETERLLDARRLRLVEDGCIFVNVGRGSVVDEAALVEALMHGSLRGALLDVFETEPLPPASPLWALPNVIISPHTAALSPTEDDRIVELFCDNLTRYRTGKRLHNLIRPERPY